MSNTSASPKDILETVTRAHEYAKSLGQIDVTPEHLMWVMLEHPKVQELFTDQKIDPAPVKAGLDSYLTGPFVPKNFGPPVATTMFNNIVTQCIGHFQMNPQGRAPTTLDLLIFLLKQPSADCLAAKLMTKAGITDQMVKRHIVRTGGGHKGEAMPVGSDGEDTSSITNRDEAEAYLGRFAQNLNTAAQDSKIDPLIGRTSEVASLVQISARRRKNNSMLIGEPGVGKTAIVEGLALRIVRGEVPEAIAKATVYALDITAVVAGTKYRGEFEERMKNIVKCFSFIDGGILFIDEVHMIMGAGGGSSGAMDAANIIKPALARGTLRCIGSTTRVEYRKHIEKDRALVRRFKTVDVAEPSLADAKLILAGLKEGYETHHGVTYTDAAIDAAVELTHRFLPRQQLPDKAIDVLDSAGATQKVADAAVRLAVVDRRQIEAEVARMAKIPETEVSQEEKARLASLRPDLYEAVYGQDKAIEALTEAFFVSRSGLATSDRPAGSFLFVGPTGVGKTETAKQFAATLGVELLRFDMSEYSQPHTVSRLIGAPPGYVGFGDGAQGDGELINKIEENPYCVLLLDEIEKAHPDLFNMMLQVMDYGRLTSSSGKPVSFRNVILIMTSNAGAKDLSKRHIGFGPSERSGADDVAINNTFAPEFRNRLDAVIKFDRLKREHVGRVVDKFLKELVAKAAERNVTLTVDEASRGWLADKGYDPEMGARPLARVIQNSIKVPLSEAMLFGSLTNGGTASFTLKDDALVLG